MSNPFRILNRFIRAEASQPTLIMGRWSARRTDPEVTILYLFLWVTFPLWGSLYLLMGALGLVGKRIRIDE